MEEKLKYDLYFHLNVYKDYGDRFEWKLKIKYILLKYMLIFDTL